LARFKQETAQRKHELAAREKQVAKLEAAAVQDSASAAELKAQLEEKLATVSQYAKALEQGRRGTRGATGVMAGSSGPRIEVQLLPEPPPPPPKPPVPGPPAPETRFSSASLSIACRSAGASFTWQSAPASLMSFETLSIFISIGMLPYPQR
jgi:hypothetical protein